MIPAFHKQIQREEFDNYQTLLDALRDYARPRDKISELLQQMESPIKGVVKRKNTSPSATHSQNSVAIWH
jgi:hypothetical protein